MPRQDIMFISEALATAVESVHFQQRLQHGAALRRQMLSAVGANQPTDHYRAVWLSQSVNKLIKYARGLCDEFDAQHPDDMASIHDLSDIVRIAYNLLDDQAKGKNNS